MCSPKKYTGGASIYRIDELFPLKPSLVCFIGKVELDCLSKTPKYLESGACLVCLDCEEDSLLFSKGGGGISSPIEPILNHLDPSNAFARTILATSGF